MKKILSVCAVLLAAFVTFTFLPKTSEAQKTIFGKGTTTDIEQIKQISLNYLRNDRLNRAVSGADDFKVQSVSFDDLKMAHTKVRQTVDDVPVWEGEAIVHLKANGELSAITDNLKDAVYVNTQPNLSAESAVDMAKHFYRGSKFLTEEPTADMWVYRAEDRDHLVYRVQMRREDGTKGTAMPVLFIDAQTGEKVFQYDNLQTATGSSLYSGTVNINTYQNGATYYMEDISRKVGTFDYRNTTSSVYRFTDTDDTWNGTTQRAAVDAHYGAEKVVDYYNAVHGRSGIDGNGGPAYYTSANGSTGLISSIVHYSTNYNNAYWNGQFMTYGDGDGSTFTPLTTLDICGHEMTHGVTERTAALTYQGESGALNEGVSDIFGAMVERYTEGESANTWKIGEDAYTPGTSGDALRYMDNPTRGNQPDNYANRYTGTADNGGVHTNSGIANYAFYLQAKGGTAGGTTVTGMGADNAAKVWYRALTVYMTSGTNFAGARTATLNAATDLFGSSSSQYAAVSNGWCAVGVGTCGAPPPPPPPGGGELIVNGGVESSQSPWASSGSGVFYTANGSYPHGGSGYLYFGVNNSTAGQTYQQVTIPSNATGAMSFWLNVTSSESGTTAYDKLFVEVRNTSGALLSTLATYSNANKGTAGAYSQKSFSLSAYKGQTVRLQFRTTTDSSVTTTFRVDDVSVK
ncbi:MAG: M4 family metallopeptidase [Acidobacteriota bacterium]